MGKQLDPFGLRLSWLPSACAGVGVVHAHFPLAVITMLCSLHCRVRAWRSHSAPHFAAHTAQHSVVDGRSRARSSCRADPMGRRRANPRVGGGSGNADLGLGEMVKVRSENNLTLLGLCQVG